jgi:uncharacterized membrane protein
MTERSPEDTGATEDFDETERGAAERLTFFSDAVVAIAITLLAIELQVPEGSTAAEIAAGFGANWGEYLAFLISFAVIGRHWISHHRLFRYVGRADTVTIWINLAWLLMIVLTPFFTRFISEEDIDFPRFALYTLAQTLQVLIFAVLVVRLNRSGAFLPDTPAHWTGPEGWLGSVITAAAFVISIPLFPLLGSWAFAAWAVVPWLGGTIAGRLGLRT